MAERERTGARERRAGGRQQRRTGAAKPFQKPDGTADRQSDGNRSQPLAAARKAAGTAAAAALAGALAGGARALAERRRRERKQTPASPAEPQSEEPTPTRSDSQTKDEAPQEPQVPEVAEDEDEEEADEPSEPERGASSSDVSKMLERARSHVQDLLGEPPESVSGIERSNGSWSVTLEVVEVHRVPETTDVLASYVVVLDGDGDLVSLERKRRYFRSQVEEGS